MALSGRHRRFVEAFLKRPVGKEAYRKAGFSPGRQAHTYRLTRRPEVLAAIKEGQHEHLREANRVVERIVAAYARVAFATIDDVLEIDADGSVSVDLARVESNSALKGFTLDESPKYRSGFKGVRRLKITLASKLHALDALAKHLGLFKT